MHSSERDFPQLNSVKETVESTYPISRAANSYECCLPFSSARCLTREINGLTGPFEIFVEWPICLSPGLDADRYLGDFTRLHARALQPETLGTKVIGETRLTVTRSPSVSSCQTFVRGDPAFDEQPARAQPVIPKPDNDYTKDIIDVG